MPDLMGKFMTYTATAVYFSTTTSFSSNFNIKYYNEHIVFKGLEQRNL